MSDTVTFRLAHPGEAAAIRALVRAAYAKWVPLIGREPRPMTADYEAALANHRFDLAVDGEAILGLIETEQRDDHLWIENIAVAPSAQGRGIGSRLLAHAEQLARDAGHSELRLLTNAAFAANLALYSRVGYAETHREPFMNGETVYMRKRLAPISPSASAI